MNPIWGTVAGIFIIVMMLTFIGIWIWAWLPRHKRSFDALARLPLEDDDDDGAGTAGGDRR
ncbi:MAG TPA: cbb3-type cytochrome c oxidase subunit 3 [Burkholderiaceae bacterium]|nr:cbb3-type cytochrome c oxidase subunit 3 [Burkholderiaceae bacterium]